MLYTTCFALLLASAEAFQATAGLRSQRSALQQSAVSMAAKQVHQHPSGPLPQRPQLPSRRRQD